MPDKDVLERAKHLLFGAAEVPNPPLFREPARALLSIVGDAIVVADAQGMIHLFNAAAERLFGFRSAEVLGQPVERLMTRHHREEHRRRLLSFVQGEGPAHRIIGARRGINARAKDGSEFAVEVSLSRSLHEGRPLLVALVRDVSERERIEEQRRLLATEVGHRFKNLMGLVSSIVSLTARGSISVAAFEESLRGRLSALGRTHDVLLSDPHGADLCELVRLEVSPYRNLSEGNVELSGPTILLQPRLATDMALALHELTTNAAKYGALSVRGGKLSIRWQMLPGEGKDCLALDWIERGGPPVPPAPPPGFGTRLIERTLGDCVRIDYAEIGVEARFRLELGGGRGS